MKPSSSHDPRPDDVPPVGTHWRRWLWAGVWYGVVVGLLLLLLWVDSPRVNREGRRVPPSEAAQRWRAVGEVLFSPMKVPPWRWLERSSLLAIVLAVAAPWAGLGYGCSAILRWPRWVFARRANGR